MKKLLWIVPLVLIIAWAACAWFIGGAAEKNIDQALKTVAYELSGSATPEGSFFTFTTENFERGFLSSTATTEISLKIFEDDEQPIVLKSKIYHGPLMFTADGIKLGASYAITTLDMEKVPADIRKDLEKGFDDEPPIRIATLADFGGGMESDVTVPHFKYSDKEDMGGMSMESKFQMAGMKMSFTVPGSGEGGAKGTVKTGEMKMTQTMLIEGGSDPMVTTMTLGLGEGSFENTRVTEGWHAEKVSEMKFPDLTVETAQFGVSLKDVTMNESMELDASGRKFDGFSRLSYATGELTGQMAEEAGDQEIVKEMLALLKAGGLLEMTFEGVDAATLASLEALISDFMKSLADPFGAMEEPAEGDAGGAPDPEAAVEKILALFQPGLKFGLRQKLGEGEKRNEMSVSLGFAGKPASEAETIGDFVNGLRGELSLRLSKTTIDATPLAQSIEGMIEGGMVEDRGDYYRSIGELADGKVSLNGTEVPVMDQFAPMMETEFSLEGLMEVFMGLGGPGMGGPDMEGGFPDGPDGFDLPTDPDAKGAAPDALKPDAAPAEPAPVPQQ